MRAVSRPLEGRHRLSQAPLPSDWSDRVEVHRKHEGKAVRAVLTPDERRDLAYALLADTDDGPARGPEAD